MEGNIEFYKNAGFSLASKLNIHYHADPKDAKVPYFLALELIPGWLQNNGIGACSQEKTDCMLQHATYCPPKGYLTQDCSCEGLVLTGLIPSYYQNIFR